MLSDVLQVKELLTFRDFIPVDWLLTSFFLQADAVNKTATHRHRMFFIENEFNTNVLYSVTASKNLFVSVAIGSIIADSFLLYVR